MGIVVLIGLVAYIAVCGVILGIFVFIFRKSSPKKIIVVQGFLIFSMAWPIWFYFGNKMFFELACKLGNPGAFVYEPFRVDVFTVANRDRYEQSWNGGPEFLKKCDLKCYEELNRHDGLLSYYQPWSVVRDGGLSVEGTWEVRSSIGSVLKHARLWVVPSGSADCIAALHNSDKCIAGKEIEKTSAHFVVSVKPFLQPVDYGGDEHLPRPNSMEWRWFGVEKHQQHLLKNDKLVASYAWYVQNLIPNSMFTSISICPSTSKDDAAIYGQRDFWKKIMAPQGTTISGPN